MKRLKSFFRELKKDPRRKKLLREINGHIELKPDGSVPDEPNL